MENSESLYFGGIEKVIRYIFWVKDMNSIVNWLDYNLARNTYMCLPCVLHLWVMRYVRTDLFFNAHYFLKDVPIFFGSLDNFGKSFAKNLGPFVISKLEKLYFILNVQPEIQILNELLILTPLKFRFYYHSFDNILIYIFPFFRSPYLLQLWWLSQILPSLPGNLWQSFQTKPICREANFSSGSFSKGFQAKWAGFDLSSQFFT